MLQTGFLWILLACALYGVLHSTLASLRVKAAAERWLGPGVRRWYRLFYVIQATVTVMPLFALVIWLPNQPLYVFPYPWVIPALLVQVLAAMGLLVGVSQTGVIPFLGLEPLLRPQQPPRPSQLVTNGLYAWVRHPLYTCGLLFLWVNPVMTWNMLALSIGLSVYMAVGAVLEERRLRHEFGKPYDTYRKRTAFLIPGLKSRR